MAAQAFTMHIENTIQPFQVTIEAQHEWTKRPHKHNFFELVYIEEGSGEQCINNSTMAYGKDSIFLLPPFDCHSFHIETPTRFVFICFNALFFKKDALHLMDYTDWFNNLHYILSNYNRQPGEIIAPGADKTMLVNLIKGIAHEYLHRQAQSDSIIRAHMFALLNILVRNFEHSLRENHRTAGRQAGDMLHYVQHNLFNNDKLHAEALAAEFHIAASYVSEYFKKKTGENLKEYILKSRVNVAQSRMQSSGQSIKEIAQELGFTDASHLSKVLKKYFPPPAATCGTGATA